MGPFEDDITHGQKAHFHEKQSYIFSSHIFSAEGESGTPHARGNVLGSSTLIVYFLS